MIDKKTLAGATGTIHGRIVSIDFKKTKNGKNFANVQLQVGKSLVRAQSFSEKVVSALEGFSEGDDIDLWGKISSRVSENDRVFTSFTALSVNEDEVTTAFTVIGKVADTSSDQYGNYVAVDVTSNPDYPEFVQLKLGSDIELEDVPKSTLRATVIPTGKYGDYTITAVAALKEIPGKPTGSAKDRFKREEKVPDKPF